VSGGPGRPGAAAGAGGPPGGGSVPGGARRGRHPGHVLHRGRRGNRVREALGPGREVHTRAAERGTRDNDRLRRHVREPHPISERERDSRGVNRWPGRVLMWALVATLLGPFGNAQGAPPLPVVEVSGADKETR